MRRPARVACRAVRSHIAMANEIGQNRRDLREYRNLLATFGRLRLVIVPRKPERFDEVASLIEQFKFYALRRSVNERPQENPPAERSGSRPHRAETRSPWKWPTTAPGSTPRRFEQAP